MHNLTQGLIDAGCLKTESVIRAFVDVDRRKFVPKDLEKVAYRNIPLPIGYGQTISQPLTVAFMLEKLDVQEGNTVLDVGSGSGWTTALLAHIVGEYGKVVGMEVIEELCALGKKNIAKFGYVRQGIAEMICRNAHDGFEKYAPYDRILVSAAAADIPQALKDQLVIGGKLVMPVGSEIICLKKKSPEEFSKQSFPGFSFVPFVNAPDQ